ncbi:hypothetical protein ABS71_02655 [bacterium SCN 62-11]|nr:metallophosphoesterase [Candidatus Eremiobacteraeota bacterium]ODT77283.1 MAG: hypothetical protein ABS71_02655 [bacterium SCN 62-11]
MRRRTLFKGAAGLALAGLAVDQYSEARGPHHTGIGDDPEATESISTIAFQDPSKIKMLQFTDMHFYQWPWRRDLDRRTREDMLRLVDLHAPDLLLITGDLWNNNPMHAGHHLMQDCLSFIESLGRPWLFTWGNHDRLDDYVAGHRTLTSARNSLYRGGKNSGCYQVHLQNRRQETLWNLICINTSGAGLAHPQQKWLATVPPEGPPAFAVFHIPLKQQSQIWVEGQGQGVKFEKVGFGVEDGNTVRQLQSLKVRACISGHDHVNDYSVPWQDVELIYGRATGYAGYGNDLVPKGGKLYVLNAENGQYAWSSVLADGSHWTPHGRAVQWRPDLWS